RTRARRSPGGPVPARATRRPARDLARSRNRYRWRSCHERSGRALRSLRIHAMQALSDVYAIPQENLDFCATIGQIAREKIAPRSAEIDERAEYPWDVRNLLAEQDILGLPF